MKNYEAEGSGGKNGWPDATFFLLVSAVRPARAFLRRRDVPRRVSVFLAEKLADLDRIFFASVSLPTSVPFASCSRRRVKEEKHR